ncbi:hypothetical protein RZ517_12625 [Roseovarius sp. S88]|uniref:Uncharacterized protein n=2 Tax=Roseovarius phycicola TaxID=3080976 RepID=A0ABZ2HJY0_9RHOB
MDLHDAEVLSVVLSSDESSLRLNLGRLCTIDPKTDWWRRTDTEATLIFNQLSDARFDGELVEYGVELFEIDSDGSFKLVCALGVIQRKCGAFEIFAVSKSETAV